ncbi:MAG TPA: putative 2-aminoethylphosphonate ABC transporter substrate-binding protein [Usitatibacter sp.]|nr:putative 2-aminoethylphosphonate ABC transporter substrate-binding protein [Usitatibacter sp.]
MFKKGSWIKPALALALCAAVGIFDATAQTELTVYTAYENDDLKAYKAAFEKDNPGITINWVRDSTGVVTAKLIAEKDNPRADVVWGLAVTSLLVLNDHDQLAAYTPKGLDKLSPNFRDPSNPPEWFGNSGWICAIIFNEAEARKKNAPKPATWKDLLNPAYKGQIVMSHPASSGTGFMYVSAWLQLYGEAEGWKFMDALHQNVARYMHSGSAPAAVAAKGEYMVGLGFDVRGSRLKEEGAPIDVILPKDGLGWDMNAMAIIKGTKKMDAAKKLVDWGISENAVRLYGATRSIAAMPGYAKPLPHLPKDMDARIMKQDFAWAAKNRARILAEWEKRYGSKSDPKKS